MFLISQALRSFVMTRASVYYRKVFSEPVPLRVVVGVASATAP